MKSLFLQMNVILPIVLPVFYIAAGLMSISIVSKTLKEKKKVLKPIDKVFLYGFLLIAWPMSPFVMIMVKNNR